MAYPKTLVNGTINYPVSRDIFNTMLSAISEVEFLEANLADGFESCWIGSKYTEIMNLRTHVGLPFLPYSAYRNYRAPVWATESILTAVRDGLVARARARSFTSLGALLNGMADHCRRVG